jgi:hypothetical protein
MIPIAMNIAKPPELKRLAHRTLLARWAIRCFMEDCTTVAWFRHLRAASSAAPCALSGASFAVPSGSCGVSDAARCGLYDVPDGAPYRSSRRTVLERLTVLGQLTVLGPQHPMR